MTADETDIISTRILTAPRERVFHAFSDPVELARWWGPEGFTNTFGEFDLRPGGRWKFVMHGPNGTDYPNEKEFIEVVESERVVFRHHDPVHGFLMTMTFDDEGDGTRLTWQMRFDSAEESAKLRDFILKANDQNFDRLEACLAEGD